MAPAEGRAPDSKRPPWAQQLSQGTQRGAGVSAADFPSLLDGAKTTVEAMWAYLRETENPSEESLKFVKQELESLYRLIRGGAALVPKSVKSLEKAVKDSQILFDNALDELERFKFSNAKFHGLPENFDPVKGERILNQLLNHRRTLISYLDNLSEQIFNMSVIFAEEAAAGPGSSHPGSSIQNDRGPRRHHMPWPEAG